MDKRYTLKTELYFLKCLISFADSKLNLAEGRPAYQSTTEVHEGVSHNASLATDGSTSLTKATCSKTGTFASVKNRQEVREKFRNSNIYLRIYHFESSRFH